MNGYLLDTSVALRSTFRSVTLPIQTRHAIKTRACLPERHFLLGSDAQEHERKLEIGDARTWWPETVAQLAAAILPLRPDHLGEIAELPPLHSDPFDRGLIAQARVEELVLVTNDAHIAKYAGSRLRVLA